MSHCLLTTNNASPPTRRPRVRCMKMCKIKKFCCCCSLRTGMLLMCLIYVVFFALSYIHAFPRNSVPPFIMKSEVRMYVLVGLLVSISAWLGIVMDALPLVFPVFCYDLVLLSLRISYVIGYYRNGYYSQNSVPQEVVFGMIQMYLLILQYSYIQEPSPVVMFNPLPHNSTSILISNNQYPINCSAVPNPVVTSVPTHQAFPLPVGNAPVQPQMYTKPQVYLPQHVMALESDQHTSSQPFPYDAPPPYSEKLSPSAPNL